MSVWIQPTVRAVAHRPAISCGRGGQKSLTVTMWTFFGQRIEIGRGGGDQRLAFASDHFRDLAW